MSLGGGNFAALNAERGAKRARGLAFARAWPEQVRRWLSGEEASDCPHVRLFVERFGMKHD